MREDKRVFCLCDAIIQNRTNPVNGVECKRRNELREDKRVFCLCDAIIQNRTNPVNNVECKRRNELRDYKRVFWYYSSSAVCCFSAAICSTIHPFHIQWMCLLAVSIRFFGV